MKKKNSPSYIKFVCYKRDKKKHFFREKKKKKTYINMKICRGRKKKSIFDTKGLREGKGWGKGRDNLCFGN